MSVAAFCYPPIYERRVNMRTQIQQMDSPTSGQVGPKSGRDSNRFGIAAPFVINGCSVTFSKSARSGDDTIKAVKEILLSAYRTRFANC